MDSPFEVGAVAPKELRQQGSPGPLDSHHGRDWPARRRQCVCGAGGQLGDVAEPLLLVRSYDLPLYQ
ncbi:MAG: hypothetical protein ACRDTH_17560 [Pseudonocardiaceae bacterium]